MKLPMNMHAPAVEATVRNFKEMIGGQALDAVMAGKRDGNSAVGLGAIAMMGLLDAALEHWHVWHLSQGLALDREEFLDLVAERFVIARAHAESYQPDQPSPGGLQ